MTTSMLTLHDIPAPTEYGQPPDWELVLVVSDSLEDQGQDNLAQSLRWLYAWDHYPHFNCGVWVFYCLPFFDVGREHGNSRYHANGRPGYDSNLTRAWLASIFPPGFLPNSYRRVEYPTFHKALLDFPNCLPSPSYTPPLLPKFQLTLPRTLTPC